MTGRIVVHGGVDMPATHEVFDVLREAARRGADVLAAASDPVAAVEAAICHLEDAPIFNAGRGSVLNAEGMVESDAGIADGSSERFAGVSGLSDTTNPIRAAVELLRRRPGPVLLAGEGARRFARDAGLPSTDLRTDEQLAIWQEVRRSGLDAAVSAFTGRTLSLTETVGCIAASAQGRLVAASSTGGLLFKMPGRVGDASVNGAGIHADADLAVLCSGQGEASIELSLAQRAASQARLHGSMAAARWAVSHGVESKSMRGAVLVYDRRTDETSAVHSGASFPVVTASGTDVSVVPATPLERVS
ncbi:MAG: isoaspartyl peptidase/L-asparaginase [Nitriliruptorales bacterium]